jgi:hypothetical protein
MSARNKLKLCLACGTRHAEPDACKVKSSLAPAHGSLADFGSEILLAQWEARADELEWRAEEERKAAMGLVAQTLEKARAYRQCILDLRRHCAAANVRQPQENKHISDSRADA